MADDPVWRGSHAPRAAYGPGMMLYALVLALVATAGCSAPFSLPSGDELTQLRPIAGQQTPARPALIQDRNPLGAVAARVLGKRGGSSQRVDLWESETPGEPSVLTMFRARREPRPAANVPDRAQSSSAAGQAGTGSQLAAEPRWPRATLGPDRRDSAIIRTSAEVPAAAANSAQSDPAELTSRQDPAPADVSAGEIAAGEMAADLGTEGLVSLTLDEALAHAESHHPLLAARMHEVSAAKGRFVTAGLLPNPELTMDSDVPVNEGRGADLRMRLMFTFPTAGKRRLREAVAASEVARARWALRSEIERVLLNAADVALEVLYLQELARLQGELSELAARRAQIERSRFEARTATFADAMEAEMDASRLALQHKDTLDRLRAARWRLAQAIGINPPQPVHVVGELPFEPFVPVALDQVLDAARASRPELAEAGAALSESHRQLELARAEAKPDIAVGPRYEDRLGDGNDSMGARLDIDLPLFDRNQGAIYERAAQTRARGAMVEAVEINTLGDVARAYVRLVSLQSRLNYYQSQVTPVVERTHATLDSPDTRRALPADQASDLLRSLLQLRLEQLQLRYDYNRLRRRLEIFLGRRVDELALPAGAILEQPAGELILPAEPSQSSTEASSPSAGPEASGPRMPSGASTPRPPGLPAAPGLVPSESTQPSGGGPMPEMPELMPLPGLREPGADPFDLNDSSEGTFELEPPTQGALEPRDSDAAPFDPTEARAMSGGQAG